MAVHYRSSGEAATALAAEVGGVALSADLRDEAEADALVQGRLRVLIPNRWSRRLKPVRTPEGRRFDLHRAQCGGFGAIGEGGHQFDLTRPALVSKLRLDHQGPRRLLLQPGDELLFGEPTAPMALAAELVAEAADAAGAADTNIELATTLDAADSGVLRGWSVGFGQSALLRLHQFSERTLKERDLDAMLGHFADGVLDLFSKADRVSVYMQREGEEYVPVLSRNRRGPCPYEQVSRTLKRVVLDSGQAVLFAISDRMLADASSLRKSSISVGLCTPLRDGEQTFGFAQVDSRGKLVPFDERDLRCSPCSRASSRSR